MKVKVCGITRPDDAHGALQAGADYLGVVLAPSPRRVDAERLPALLASAPGATWVGVFASAGAGEIARTASASGLRIVQLSGDEGPETAEALHAAGLSVWRSIGVGDPPDWAEALRVLERWAGRADAFVLDRRRRGAVGGTGRPVSATAPTELRTRLAGATFVLAGGLSAGNVAAAATSWRPDVVDASSRLEVGPGRKDPERVRAFVAAAKAVAA